MTWAEFKLRLIGFNRMERNKSVELRVLCYYSGLNLDPSKVKKPSDLWKIDGVDEAKRSRPSKRAIELFNREMEKVKKIKANG